MNKNSWNAQREQLKKDCEVVTKLLKNIIYKAKDYNLYNTQEYIDFEDFLNRCSNIDYNKSLDSL